MTKTTKKLCTIDGCKSSHKARGWCEKHYQRFRAHGDPLKTERIRTSSAEESFALRTEWQGDCLIWTGTKTRGYGRIRVNGKIKATHRYAWEREYGPIPAGMQVDHRHHCSPSCVNVEHLRLATHTNNLWNRKGPERRTRSGVRNVYPRDGGWMVVVTKAWKQHYFGVYQTIPEAAKVAEYARRELFGEFAGRGRR